MQRCSTTLMVSCYSVVELPRTSKNVHSRIRGSSPLTSTSLKAQAAPPQRIQAVALTVSELHKFTDVQASATDTPVQIYRVCGQSVQKRNNTRRRFPSISIMQVGHPARDRRSRGRNPTQKTCEPWRRRLVLTYGRHPKPFAIACRSSALHNAFF